MPLATAAIHTGSTIVIDVRNPFDFSLVGKIAQTSMGELVSAVARARTAQRGFRTSMPHVRRALLKGWPARSPTMPRRWP